MPGRWRIPDHVQPALLGGLSSGLVAALLFATAHALIIAPIWTRMWNGLAWGALAGLAGGWALVELHPDLASTTSRRSAALGAAFGGTLWLLVAPVSMVDAVLRRLGGASRYESVEVAVAVTLALGAGAAFGWLRTRRRRAAIACAAATLLVTIAMAGPVPIARSSRALGIFLAVLPVALLAGVVLALVVRRMLAGEMARRDAQKADADRADYADRAELQQMHYRDDAKKTQL